MILKWTPYWYELDDSIIVGDIDWFCVSNNERFANNTYGLNDVSFFQLEIIDITHSTLGKIRGIVTIGLDYTIYLNDGNVIQVNAEEQPGTIYDSNYEVHNWTFDVSVKVIAENGQLNNYTNHNRNELIDKYKRLLGITNALWDK